MVSSPNASTSRADRSRTVAFTVVPAAALVAQMGMRWVRRGTGSTLRGDELAAQLRLGVWAPSWGPMAAMGLYGTALAGCALVATAHLHRPSASGARLIIGALVIVTMAVLTLSGALPPSNWAFGPMATTAGALVLVVGGYIQLRDGRATRDLSSVR